MWVTNVKMALLVEVVRVVEELVWEEGALFSFGHSKHGVTESSGSECRHEAGKWVTV